MNKLGIACLASTLAMLQACDGDSSDNSSQTVTGENDNTETTNFSISVDAPEQLLASHTPAFSFGLVAKAYAAAADGLDKDNFAVAVIGPDGNVVETVTLTSDNWSREPDGTYNITLPGGERLDCVVLVSLDDGTPAVRLGEPLPQDVLLAPTTSEQLQVDLNSSVAYQAIINEIVSADGWGDYASAVGSNPEDIESADDLVNELITNVAERVDSVVANLGTLNFDVAAVLASPEVKELAANIVDRIQTEKTAVTINVAEALEQGFWWLYSEIELNNNGEYTVLEAGKFNYDGETTSENMYEWLSDSGSPIALDNPMTSTQSLASIDFTNLDIDGWVLTDSDETKWKPVYDMIVFRSADDSKAIFADIGLVDDTDYDHQLALQQIDISGKKVASFLTFPEALEFIPLLPPDLTFGEGAKAYKLEESMVNAYTRYQIWHDTDCDSLLNGSCNRTYINGTEAAPTELNALFSEAATDSQQIGEVNGAWLSRDLLAEIVNDENKTLVLWQRVAGDNFNKVTSNWTQPTINGVDLISFTVPEEIAEADYDFDDDERDIFFTVHEGYVRRGAIISSVDTGSELLFNQSAIDTIYDNASIDNLPEFDRCSLGNKESEATEGEYIQAISQCGYTDLANYLSTFYNMNLVRINSKGEVRANQFLENSTLNYYKNGKQSSSQNWEIDNGIIRISYGDDDLENGYEMLALTDVDVENGQYAFKVFTHDYVDEEAGYIDEIWSYAARRYNPQTSLEGCATGDSQYDDTNEVPVAGTERTQADYEQAVANCMQYGEDERKPLFTERALQGNALQSIENSTEYMLFFDTDEDNDEMFDGEFRDSDENDPEVVKFEWIVVDGKLQINAAKNQHTVTELGTITHTNSIEFVVKHFYQQSNWATDFDYMEEGEGEIWSDTYRVIEIDAVPEVTIPDNE